MIISTHLFPSHYSIAAVHCTNLVEAIAVVPIYLPALIRIRQQKRLDKDIVFASLFPSDFVMQQIIRTLYLILTIENTMVQS